jgi:porphobilinogen synthase
MVRLRRLRKTPAIRALVRENHLHADELVWPIFVTSGVNQESPVDSMPGVKRYSPDRAAKAVEEVMKLGVKAVILFGIPDCKDEEGSSSWDENGPVPEAIRRIKCSSPDCLVIADVCLCEYTSHGHCGLLDEAGQVINDKTVELLTRAALTYARAGADIVAPSDMMDGRVKAIRTALDEASFVDVAIMAYSAKYASAWYGPFREAADSAPQFGDRLTYQMDPANAREARREVEADIEEGADIVIVKPALACLDIVHDISRSFDVPVVAYSVSGEYAMVKAAAANGWIDERKVVLESLLAMKRAGATAIITYHAPDVARYLAEAR